MRLDLRPWSLLALLALASCDGEGKSSNSPNDGAKGGKGSKASCAKGLVDDLRAARLAEPPSDYAATRATLRDSCDAGCGVACLEYARNSWDRREADDYNQRACDAGEADGCARLSSADASARAKLCESGDALACSGGEPSVAIERSASACAQDDGRSCAVHGWTRCAFLGQCDAEAVDDLRKAARLVPERPIIEALAAAMCQGGAGDPDAYLAGVCDSGQDYACGLRCEELVPGRKVLVRPDDRATYEEVLTLAQLQANVTAGWFPTISVMDPAAIAKTQKVLQVFTPAMTEAGASAKVPEDVRTTYPVLVAAILRAPQLDAKKVKYWLKRLPDMEDEQRANLMDSLRNQWWVLPQEGSRSPVDVIDDTRWTSGGFGPLPRPE